MVLAFAEGAVAIEVDDDSSVDAAPVAAAAAAASPAAASAVSKRSNSSLSSVSAPPAPKRALTQQTLFSALASTNNAALADATALFFASNHIAYNVADSPSFLAFTAAVRSSTAAVPRRRALKVAVSSLAERLRDKVVQRIRGGTAPVTVATDGWTNVRHTKVTNVVLLHGGAAFYWCSIPNTYAANTAAWLSDQLAPHLHELVQLGIRFTALVADNESVNDALFDLLTVPFPFLIRVPCAAHTIQLVVKQVILLPRFDATLSVVRRIIAHFEQKMSDRQRLRQLQQSPGQHEYTLVKPNDTRWNSQLLACIRLLQRDSVTLHDVWLQMNVLHQHILSGRAKHGRTLTDRAAAALKQRWNRQVNQPATIACALLSLTADLSRVNEEVIDEAKKFIVKFGCSYLLFCKLAGGMDETVLRGTLLSQLSGFIGHRDGFATVEEELHALQAAQGAAFNPLDVWDQHSGVLSLVAKALLSITASEAAVERSFSAQDAVHTKKRNRLLDVSVQQEMFVKFNTRALDKMQHQSERPLATIDLDPNVDCFPPEADSDSESVDTEASDRAAAVEASASEGEEGHSAAAAAAAPVRSPSDLDEQTESFLDAYIAKHGITTDAISARRYWNGDRTNALQCAAIEQLGRGAATVGDLIKNIAQILATESEE